MVKEILPSAGLGTKKFLKILLPLSAFFVIGGVFYFIFFKKPSIPSGVSSYQTLNRLVEKYADAQKTVENKNDVYSLKGNLVRLSLGKNLVTYEYDLGKGVLLGPREEISLPVSILPVEYFGKKISKKEELDLGKGELNIFSELKIWCKTSKEEEKSCQVSKWAIYSVSQVKEPGPHDEIAEKVLAWLERQKNERGVYDLGQLCRLDGTCQTAGQDNRCGLAAIWGRFKHLKKRVRSEDLEILRKDLTTYTDPQKIPVIQNDLWNCKFMYEMWQSDQFSPEEKKKIENICFFSNYSHLPEVEKIVESSTYQERHNLQELLTIKRYYTIPPTVLSASGGETTQFSAYASDFATRFLWKQDFKDLTRARIYFDKAIDAYISERNNRFIGGRCLLGIASLDLYQGSTEARYFDFASTLFEKEEMDKTCLAKEGEVFPNRCQDSLFEQATCSLFAKELFKVTEATKYQVVGEKIVKNLIEKSFDAQGYKGEFSGDGSFYSWGRGVKEKDVNIYKSVKENGLVVGVLSGED